MHNVVSIRPLSSIFQLYYHTPGSTGTFWTTADTLEDAYRICRKHGNKILWITDSPCGLKGEILSAPEDKGLTWQPDLTRKQVKDIYGSQLSFCEFLSGKENQPARPENLEDLMELGIMFGGWIQLAPAIKKKLAGNEDLLFENYSGFSVLLDRELAKAYVNYHG